MSKNGIITENMIGTFRENFKNSKNKQVAKNAIINSGIQKATMNIESKINNNYTFSDEIKTGKATFQKRSGRCWLFAGLNVFRQKIAEDLKIKEFELSQNYMMFWDKLEKSNYFLENILETLEEGIYSRIIMWLLSNPLQDGGQWDMFSALVEKYGVVPKYMMPESYHSGDSRLMNKVLTAKLREYASKLRKKYKTGGNIEEVKKLKNDMMGEIYGMLVCFLGEPPASFDFEYRDDDDNFNSDRNITPKVFFNKYVGVNLDDYVSIINAPTQDKPFNKTFTVKYLGNVRESRGVLYLNVDNDTMKDLAVSQLKDNKTVWFGCDMGQMVDRESGIMDADLYLLDDVLGVPFEMAKAERLVFGESQLTHAMVFTGVNLVDGKPNRWKVQNSWGDKNGNEGYFVMSDRWFDEYNYQIIVEKKYLSDELKEALTLKPIVLPPWDPMGSLAMMLG